MTASELSIWGDIANIVIAVASVATAIVTAFVLCKQHKLQQEQLNAQQLEHQPSFHSEYNSESDQRIISCDCYDMWTTAHIQLTSLIAVQICMDFYTVASYYIPIQYYTHHNFTGKLRGELATYKNDDFFITSGLDRVMRELNRKVHERVSPSQFAQVFKVDVVKIEYTDQYHIKREVYFLDNDKSTERRYNEFIGISRSISLHPLKVRDIDIEKTIKEIMRMQYIQKMD